MTINQLFNRLILEGYPALLSVTSDYLTRDGRFMTVPCIKVTHELSGFSGYYYLKKAATESGFESEGFGYPVITKTIIYGNTPAR